MVRRATVFLMQWGRAAGILFILAALTSEARADRVSVQSRQVRKASNYKVRLSAALGLAKTKDSRAVSALAYALENDGQSTVRRIAAVSLGRMVTSSTSSRARKQAIGALSKAAASDGDRKVRQNATRSLNLVGSSTSSSGSSTARARKSSVYLAVGKPKDRTRKAPSGTEKQMLTTLRKVLRQHAPAFQSSSTSLPTKKELQNMGAQGYYIGSAVASLRVSKRGRQTVVSCSVQMRVSPWDGKDGNERLVAGKAASASGTGKVLGASSKGAISNSKRDCVLAVIEQITARQVVPFLQRTAGKP